MIEPASTPYQIEVSEDAPWHVQNLVVRQGKGAPLAQGYVGGRIAFIPFSLAPVRLGSRVELLGPPPMVAQLALLSTLLGVASPEWWLLILELAEITTPND